MNAIAPRTINPDSLGLYIINQLIRVWTLSPMPMMIPPTNDRMHPTYINHNFVIIGSQNYLFGLSGT